MLLIYVINTSRRASEYGRGRLNGTCRPERGITKQYLDNFDVGLFDGRLKWLFRDFLKLKISDYQKRSSLYRICLLRTHFVSKRTQSPDLL